MPCKCHDSKTGIIDIQGDGSRKQYKLNSPICYDLIKDEKTCSVLTVYHTIKSVNTYSGYEPDTVYTYAEGSINVYAPFGGMSLENVRIAYVSSGRPYWTFDINVICNNIVKLEYINGIYQWSECKPNGTYVIEKSPQLYWKAVSLEVTGVEYVSGGQPMWNFVSKHKDLESKMFVNKPVIKVKCGCKDNECECNHQGYTCCIDSNGNSRRL